MEVKKRTQKAQDARNAETTEGSKSARRISTYIKRVTKPQSKDAVTIIAQSNGRASKRIRRRREPIGLRLGRNHEPRKLNPISCRLSPPYAALVNDFSLELTPYLIVYSGSKPDKAV